MKSNGLDTTEWLDKNHALISHTPQVIIHRQKLISNIIRMSEFARRHNVMLRPHFKTHKTEEIVNLQLEHQAIGVTVAKISEAEALFASSALNKQASILIAFPLVSDQHFQRVHRLMDQGCSVILMLDHLDQARSLNSYAQSHNLSIPYYIKINSGLNRCGIDARADLLLAFIKEVQQYSNIKLLGIMTHAGHAYAAQSSAEVERIGRYEGEIMVSLSQHIAEELNLSLKVSVGSTPTVMLSGAVAGVDEIRPGNYVFYDRTQVMLGSATWNDCALRVVAQVVSQPSENRWVIDAGAKTLALDLGAHGSSTMKGYGHIVGHPELSITRLSEEHGVLEGETSSPPKLGDFIEIIPNHACPVVNLADQLTVLDFDQNHVNIEYWPVIGRGKNY